MKRRDFLLGTGAAMTMTSLGGCAPRATTQLPSAYAPVRAVLTDQISQGVFPGSVFLLAKGDDIAVSADGVTTIGGDKPMARDTIFRIASMSKTITAAAVLMCVQDGKLTLDENAERLLPELANRRVLRTLRSELDDTVPARAPITVRQLMDFTFGFGLSFDAALPIMQEGNRQQLTLAQPTPFTPHDPDEWMRRFGALPLMYQPGERWLYNVGALIQGVLVKRASGKDFDAFVEERITGPLGMRDTGFFVPANKLDRFAGCGVFTDPQSHQQTRMDQDGAQSAYANQRPVFPSGAGGLCSTVDDFLAFARLLKNGGEHNGQRLLSAEHVRLMTTNQLSDAQRIASAQSLVPGYFENHGWAFGAGVQTGADDVTQTPGAYGWDGGFGTNWFTDPNRDVISIVMTQSSNFLFNGARDRFRAAVYAATA
jgi:CubicO group peptidase (beta-lactamase class C family)